jgi:uncharacterized RDD family membrane protein YckC
MQCPSCGVISDSDDFCPDCNAGVKSNDDDIEVETLEVDESQPVSTARPQSRLIEFPGVSRNAVPEWRKELSERVREVQERKAREAANEAEQLRVATNTVSPPQLELLPQAEAPVINPLVAAALKRIERAHQGAPIQRSKAVAAVAYAPAREEHESLQPSLISPEPQLSFEPELQTAIIEEPREKTVNLVIVPHPEPVTAPDPAPAPKRLISDDLNDPALNYLDTIPRDVWEDEHVRNRASAFRRLVGAFFDIIICGALTSPIAAAIWYTGNNLRDTRTIIILAACIVVVAFLYFTINTALTGRTWAMRLFSMRVIDVKTGLIPTGGQSIGRSFLYLISLATAGLGILFALVSREGYTAHDRFTRTAVITT